MEIRFFLLMSFLPSQFEQVSIHSFRTFLCYGRGTLNVGSFQEKDVLSPDIVRFSYFLERLAERYLERDDWAGHFSLQKFHSLLVF